MICSTPFNWILSSTALTIILQLIFFSIAFFLQSDLLTDMAASVNFVIVALVGALGCHRTGNHFIPLRTVLLCLMVCVWACRLGIFQLTRLWAKKRDSRFDSMRSSPIKFAGFWALQAAWILIVSLPLTLVNGSGSIAALQARGIGFWDVFGVFIWICGLVCEVRADHEKYIFSLIPRADRTLPFITTGLWSLSRHPNYFGEIVLWAGYWFVASQGLRPFCTTYFSYLLILCITLLSPIFTFYLLVFVSGMPIAESYHDRRYSKLIAYQQYKAITSPLIPISPRFYAYIHPRIKKSFFFETNSISMTAQIALPKFKAGTPVQYSNQSLR